MAITNLTGLTNITNFGFYHFFEFGNSVSGGWFVGMLIIAFTFVLFISLKQYETEKALAVTCFAGLILSIILKYIALVNMIFIIVYAIGLASTMAYIYIIGSK